MKIQVVSFSGDVVHTVDCTGKSERQIDRIEYGLNINLDHDNYFTRILTE